ncbi:hypothetical protein [Rhodococcus sp. Chr-9]|uniref:DUF7620 family protein n=1 Tax=Rhodococcus sp. Chr-9 TaxID=713612 RepID=UPI000A5AE00E|nr:hypothetical protein [Rhodococcus sp. Chr-9]
MRRSKLAVAAAQAGAADAQQVLDEVRAQWALVNEVTGRHEKIKQANHIGERLAKLFGGDAGG